MVRAALEIVAASWAGSEAAGIERLGIVDLVRLQNVDESRTFVLMDGRNRLPEVGAFESSLTSSLLGCQFFVSTESCMEEVGSLACRVVDQWSHLRSLLRHLGCYALKDKEVVV